MIEEAIEQFRKELREAVLTRKKEVEYRKLTDECFQMIVRIRITIKRTKELVFTVEEADGFICYHEDLTDGMFDNDIKELSKMYREIRIK